MTANQRKCLGLAAVFALLSAPGVNAESRGFRFTTLEGEVRAVGEYREEGQLGLLTAELAPVGRPAEAVTILLGPVEVCREIGLLIVEGDRLRVRVFVGDDGQPVKAQKVLNLSRGVMARLRTMRDVPLWSSAGVWQGGPGQHYRGGQHGGRAGGTGVPGRRPGGF